MNMTPERMMEIAIKCGAGIAPNPCNAEMLITFTQYELQSFAERIIAEESAQDYTLGKISGVENMAAIKTLFDADRARDKATIAMLRKALLLLQKNAESYGKAWAEANIAEYDRVASAAKKLRYDLLAIAQNRLAIVPEALSASHESAASFTKEIRAKALEDARADLQAEFDEQCRLLGMGSEREARLMAVRDELQREVDLLKAELQRNEKA